MIKLKRDSGWADSVRAYKVVLDSEVIGNINDGEEKEFDVDVGHHELFLKIDWCRSNSIKFNMGDSIEDFECGSSLRGWKVLMAMIYVIFLRDKYLWLKKVS